MDNLYLFPSFRYYRFPHLTVDRMYRRHCVKHDWTRTIHSPFIPSSEHSRQWQSVIRGVRSTYRASVSKRSRLGCFARLAAMLCPCVPLVTVPLIVVKYHARSCSKITRRYVKSISPRNFPKTWIRKEYFLAMSLTWKKSKCWIWLWLYLGLLQAIHGLFIVQSWTWYAYSKIQGIHIYIYFLIIFFFWLNGKNSLIYNNINRWKRFATKFETRQDY